MSWSGSVYSLTGHGCGPRCSALALETDRAPHRCGPQGAGKRESPDIPHQPKLCSSSGFSFSLVPSVISMVLVASQGLRLPPSLVLGSPHSPVGSREVRQTLRKVSPEARSTEAHGGMGCWNRDCRVCLSLEGGLRGTWGQPKRTGCWRR